MRKITWTCVALFLAGILCTQLIGYEKLRELTQVDGATLLQYANTQVDLVQRYFNVLWERMKMSALLVLLAASRLGNKAPVVVLCGFCFVMGLFGGVCMVGVGWPGILLALASLFPQCLLYVAAVWIALRVMSGRGQFVRGRKTILQNVMYELLAAMLMILGTILETTAGHALVCYVIRLIA